MTELKDLLKPFTLVGRFSGSMGAVLDTVYQDGRRPVDSQPDVIMVHFPKYTGPDPVFLENPDFAWDSNLILNEDRLCHAPNTPMIISPEQKCLLESMLNVPVNNYGHVGTLPPFQGTCTQN